MSVRQHSRYVKGDHDDQNGHARWCWPNQSCLDCVHMPTWDTHSSWVFNLNLKLNLNRNRPNILQYTHTHTHTHAHTHTHSHNIPARKAFLVKTSRLCASFVIYSIYCDTNSNLKLETWLQWTSHRHTYMVQALSIGLFHHPHWLSLWLHCCQTVVRFPTDITQQEEEPFPGSTVSVEKSS